MKRSFFLMVLAFSAVIVNAQTNITLQQGTELIYDVDFGGAKTTVTFTVKQADPMPTVVDYKWSNGSTGTLSLEAQKSPNAARFYADFFKGVEVNGGFPMMLHTGNYRQLMALKATELKVNADDPAVKFENKGSETKNIEVNDAMVPVKYTVANYTSGNESAAAKNFTIHVLEQPRSLVVLYMNVADAVATLKEIKQANTAAPSR